MKVVHPDKPIRGPLSVTGPIRPVFQEDVVPVDDVSDILSSCKVPLFQLEDGEYQVLVKDLAALWHFPSSYQLLAHMKNCDVKSHLKRTTLEENKGFCDGGLITSADIGKRHFYFSLRFLLSILSNKEILTSEEDDNSALSENLAPAAVDENRINLNQVLPQYGEVASTLDLTFATFNSLNKLSKYKFYKSLPMYQRLLPPSKLPPSDLELLAQENDYSTIETQEPEPEPERQGPAKRGRKPLGRKPLGKFRKYYTGIDPNTLDLTESLIPGQGYIQEFNVNHLCKIPNYYASRGTLQPALIPAKKPDTKVLKNVQQLSYTELDSALSKYFYTKSHRGVGSGNYKDASFANKLNRIPSSRTVIQKSHKSPRQLHRLAKRRAEMHIKGLVHEMFHNKVVQEMVSIKRDEVEDHSNIEMLHATLQYNLLVNSYREIARETWGRYYEFKMIDFDQLVTLKKEQLERQQREKAIQKKVQDPNAVVPPELLHPRVTVLNNIVGPTTYKEITNRLPLNLRNNNEEDLQEQPIKKPVRLTTVYPNPMNSDLAFNVESVRVPNSNSIGWDNLKKYGDLL